MSAARACRPGRPTGARDVPAGRAPGSSGWGVLPWGSSVRSEWLGLTLVLWIIKRQLGDGGGDEAAVVQPDREPGPRRGVRGGDEGQADHRAEDRTVGDRGDPAEDLALGDDQVAFLDPTFPPRGRARETDQSPPERFLAED